MYLVKWEYGLRAGNIVQQKPDCVDLIGLSSLSFTFISVLRR